MKNFPLDNKLQSPPSFSQEDLNKRLAQLIVDRDETIYKISDNVSKEKARQLEKSYNDICNQISAIEIQLTSLPKDSSVERLSILTSYRDSLKKQIRENPNSNLEKELNDTLKQISKIEIENVSHEWTIPTFSEDTNNPESISYDSSQASGCRSSSSSGYSSSSSFSSSSPIYDPSLVSGCRSSSSSSYSSDSSFSSSSPIYDSSLVSNCRSSSSSSYSSSSSFSSNSPADDSSQVFGFRSSSSSSLTSSFSSGFNSNSIPNFELAEDTYLSKDEKYNNNPRYDNDQVRNDEAIARAAAEEEEEYARLENEKRQRMASILPSSYKGDADLSEDDEEQEVISSVFSSLPSYTSRDTGLATIKDKVWEEREEEQEQDNSEAIRVRPPKIISKGGGFFDTLPKKLPTSEVKPTAVTGNSGSPSKTGNAFLNFFEVSLHDLLPTSEVKPTTVTGDSGPLPSNPIDEEKRVFQLKTTLETEIAKWKKIIQGFLTPSRRRNVRLLLNALLKSIGRIQHVPSETRNSRADYENALSCWQTAKSSILSQVKGSIETNPEMRELLQKLNPEPINHETLNTQQQKTLSL